MELSNPFIQLGDHKQCSFCQGFYENSHGQPVCNTCHLFLFSLDPGELERSSGTEDDQNGDDEQSLDSGNEEPVDHPELETGGDQEIAVMNGDGLNTPHRLSNTSDQVTHPARTSSNANTQDSVDVLPSAQEELNRRIRALSNFRPFNITAPATSDHHDCHFTSGVRNGPLKCATTSRLPEELLVTKIFPHLDDIQLFMCSRVCRRWKRIILSLGLPWHTFVASRWPLFSPKYEVMDWYEIFGRLVDSTFCHRCLWSITPLETTSAAVFCSSNSVGMRHGQTYNNSNANNQIITNNYPQGVNRGWSVPAATLNQSHATTPLTDHNNIANTNNNQIHRNYRPTNFTHSMSAGFISSTLNSRVDQDSWRNRRLMSEFQNLKCDPFLGIDAVRLDPGGYLWQASVEGPIGTPYEGGVFFIFMFIPENYPLKAPIVRFQTKILHPNVSLHGDIGIESIGGANWIPTLTLSKVLLSVLSLLTDPNCEISMNAEAARLYRTDQSRFNRLSKMFTYKYAMVDYINTKSSL